MKISEICSYLDSEVPLSFQESYDNSGLQIGLPDKEINSALITLDITEDVIDEAITRNCDIIFSHHPLIFKPVKRISDNTFTERVIYKAIKHDIAIYSMHTNLDAFTNGVSRRMAEKLNLTDIKVLCPLEKKLLKLVTYIPESHIDKVRNAIFDAGAGVIGNYDECGFSANGTGSFRGNEGTSPFVGEPGKIHFEKEIRFETVLFSHLKEKVVKALLDNHPYEEVAYDIYALENVNIEPGIGCTGKLAEPVSEQKFLELIFQVFGSKGIRYSKTSGKSISRVALCGGSGSMFLKDAISSRADAYVTADIKYHTFFEAENKILLVDSGHFESEKFSAEIIKDLILKKFPKFAVRFSEVNTNPINYF
jgi:dinuclear metal center YbgI/SA1388 family protein